MPPIPVTGLVLSIGESSTECAVNALKSQTHACAAIHVVKDVTPFHRAMNQGIDGVDTPYFLQCDADMVPDEDCIEVLCRHLDDRVGVVIGLLQDPLMGKIQAIKLFRTECVRQIPFEDHVSPDTNLISKLTEANWNYVFASRSEPLAGRENDVFGDHSPEYTELYTFQKFRLEGVRMRQRGIFQELLDALDRLAENSHPMARIAIIGLCTGIFEEREGDGLSPYRKDGVYNRLEEYMQANADLKHVFSTIA